MRGALSILALLALLLSPTLAPAQSPSAESATVTAKPITRFQRANVGEPLGPLIFKGGLDLTSPHPDFGGLSSLAFVDADRFVMVSDEGHFVSGILDLTDGAPSGLSDVEIDVIRNSSGAPLPRKFTWDSEAIDVVFRDGAPAAVRVGFEHLTRVAEFALTDGRPGGPAREIAIPDWLTDLRTNGAIESLCMAPPASPVAGSTLIITESHSIIPDTWAATLLGNADRGDLAITISGRFNPTDCAFLPDGDLLVLERSFAFLTFSMQLRRIPAERVRAGAIMDGDILFSASGREVDNFEGLGVRVLPDGEVRVTIVSDNNFLGLQRSLLLDFAFPDEELTP